MNAKALKTSSYTSLSEYMYSWRTELGLTQEELAYAADVSRVTISDLETGATQGYFPLVVRVLKALQEEGAPYIDIYRLQF